MHPHRRRLFAGTVVLVVGLVVAWQLADRGSSDSGSNGSASGEDSDSSATTRPSADAAAVANLEAKLREAVTPALAFAGGVHQVIAEAKGGALAPAEVARRAGSFAQGIVEARAKVAPLTEVRSAEHCITLALNALDLYRISAELLGIAGTADNDGALLQQAGRLELLADRIFDRARAAVELDLRGDKAVINRLMLPPVIPDFVVNSLEQGPSLPQPAPTRKPAKDVRATLAAGHRAVLDHLALTEIQITDAIRDLPVSLAVTSSDDRLTEAVRLAAVASVLLLERDDLALKPVASGLLSALDPLIQLLWGTAVKDGEAEAILTP